MLAPECGDSGFPSPVSSCCLLKFSGGLFSFPKAISLHTSQKWNRLISDKFQVSAWGMHKCPNRMCAGIYPVCRALRQVRPAGQMQRQQQFIPLLPSNAMVWVLTRGFGLAAPAPSVPLRRALTPGRIASGACLSWFNARRCVTVSGGVTTSATASLRHDFLSTATTAADA